MFSSGGPGSEDLPDVLSGTVRLWLLHRAAGAPRLQCSLQCLVPGMWTSCLCCSGLAGLWLALGPGVLSLHFGACGRGCWGSETPRRLTVLPELVGFAHALFHPWSALRADPAPLWCQAGLGVVSPLLWRADYPRDPTPENPSFWPGCHSFSSTTEKAAPSLGLVPRLAA